MGLRTSVAPHPSTMVSLVENMLDLNKRLSESKTGHEKTLLQRQIEATDRQNRRPRPRALRPLGGVDRHRRGRRPVIPLPGGRGLAGGHHRRGYISDSILVIRYNVCILDGHLPPPSGGGPSLLGICSRSDSRLAKVSPPASILFFLFLYPNKIIRISENRRSGKTLAQMLNDLGAAPPSQEAHPSTTTPFR